MICTENAPKDDVVIFVVSGVPPKVKLTWLAAEKPVPVTVTLLPTVTIVFGEIVTWEVRTKVLMALFVPSVALTLYVPAAFEGTAKEAKKFPPLFVVVDATSLIIEIYLN